MLSAVTANRDILGLKAMGEDILTEHLDSPKKGPRPWRHEGGQWS